MPAKLYDFECPKGHIFEELAEYEEVIKRCSCGDMARRIISVSGQYLGNQNTNWLYSVLEVVDRESKAKHVQEFVKNPTRETYKNWMKGEGIRPADYKDHGGPPVYRKPPLISTEEKAKFLYERHRARKSISMSSSPLGTGAQET